MARQQFLVAVYLIITNDNGEILFQRRQGTKLWPNFLALPAGHIDEIEPVEENEINVETSIEAAIREAREELGIKIKKTDLVKKFILERTNKSLPPYFDIFFEVKNYSGEITIAEPDKCSELRWINPSNIPDDVIDFEIYALTKISDGQPFGGFYADNEKN